MRTGARLGRPAGLRQLLTAALSAQLDVFVLPGVDVASAAGLDLEAAGARVVATPRHATLLLVVGELPAGLREAAVVVYAQMPRPRVLIALGAGDVSPLPLPDVAAAADQHGLEHSLEEARRHLREGAWSLEAQPFEADALVPKRRRKKERPSEKPGPAHQPQHGQMDHAKAGHGGMDHGPADHGGMDHGRAADGRAEPDPAGGGREEPGRSEHAGMRHDAREHGGRQKRGTQDSAMQVGDMQHGGMQDGGMQHGGASGGMPMGFMSMVRLTQHLPRSSDGLPMERVQAPFGPFFPALPSGLDLTLWLDGDTVARVVSAQGAASRGIEASLVGDVAGLPDRLARVDPLAPRCYRRLAVKALEAAGMAGPEPAARLGWLAAVELERAASHLNWLSRLGFLLGYGWLASEAGRWQRALRGSRNVDEVAELESLVGAFLQRVRRTLLLARRLRGLGRLPGAELGGVSGPVARASGLRLDARLADQTYQELGFEPVVRSEADALARLAVRLDEVSQSLGLVRAWAQQRSAGDRQGSASLVPQDEAASSLVAAEVESPRGRASLELAVDGRRVVRAALTTPSPGAQELIERVALDAELADALVAVASLDISPWEVDG